PPTLIYTLSLHDALPISSSFISRRISSVGKELICAVRGFSCSVNGIDSPGCGIADEITTRSDQTATGNGCRCSWAIRPAAIVGEDRKSTRLNSSHVAISY